MSAEKPVILTPGGGRGLVWREAVRALDRAGYTVVARDAERLFPRDLARIFALPPERSGLPGHPALFFSINFHGLDTFGESFSVLRKKGVPVAVWCVDNPWNLLSGLRTDVWKDAHLFLTDPSFIPGLRAHGAKHTTFLPLAADADTFARSKTPPALETAKAVFVGRSAFPDKERFFVGQKVPDDPMRTAQKAMGQGTRPDFSWWLHELGVEGAPLWPGSLARRAALGAEEASLAWKTACLQEAAPEGLSIYGDAGWRELFPQTGHDAPTIHPPVDYYTALRGIYASAPVSLNMTSFLLPHGLNQRHFDIWTAGGFCLMDECPGQALFPTELTTPVTFRKSGDIPKMINDFMQRPEERKRMTATWRDHILAEHTYDHRMRVLTKTIFS